MMLAVLIPPLAVACAAGWLYLRHRPPADGYPLCGEPPATHCDCCCRGRAGMSEP